MPAIEVISIRAGTAAAWTSANPVLAFDATLGIELGVESDTGLFKVGDNSTAWNSRPYATVGPTATQILTDKSLTSPTLTGTPIAPTASVGTNTTQIATTAFVQAAFPTVVASGNLTAQSAAVSSMATFTPSATGTFRISAYLNITSVVTDVIVITVTYKDENGTSQSIASSSISAVGNNSFDLIIRSNNTAIVVKTTLTTGVGTIAYDVGCTIEQLN